MDPEMTYERACEEHSWNVPERYNIAADVCDKHPPEKLAMVWERFDGERREVEWGELQELSDRAANMLAERGVGKGDRVAVVLPPTPETAAIFFGTWKLGAILLSMSVLYGDDGIRHRLDRLGGEGAGHRRRQRRPLRPGLVEEVIVLSPELLAAASSEHVEADTAADDPAQLYYTSGTTGMAKGIVHAHRYILAHEEFVYCHDVHGRRALPRHGRVGLGGGDLAAARPVAARRRAVRVPAQGRLRPGRAARLPRPQRRRQRVHDADGDAGDDGDRQRRRGLSDAGAADRLLGRRAAQPRGDQVVPRAVRDHGARLLRADRVLSALRQLPVHGGARGLDGPA